MSKTKEPRDKEKRFCQFCRYHKNKPVSMCYFSSTVVLHTPRKGTCLEWRIKKGS